jgi:hypothetical protein
MSNNPKPHAGTQLLQNSQPLPHRPQPLAKVDPYMILRASRHFQGSNLQPPTPSKAPIQDSEIQAIFGEGPDNG